MPVYEKKGGHPILLSSFIANYLAGIKNYSLKLKQILSRCNKKTIEVASSNILANINTPDDYQFYYPKNDLCLI